MRGDYSLPGAGLTEADARPDPMQQFDNWYTEYSVKGDEMCMPIVICKRSTKPLVGVYQSCFVSPEEAGSAKNKGSWLPAVGKVLSACAELLMPHTAGLRRLLTQSTFARLMPCA